VHISAAESSFSRLKTAEIRYVSISDWQRFGQKPSTACGVQRLAAKRHALVAAHIQNLRREICLWQARHHKPYLDNRKKSSQSPPPSPPQQIG
jgi:hypothetical protein